MTTDKLIDDVNVTSEEVLISPAELKQKLPNTEQGQKNVLEGRQTIKKILDRACPAIFVIVGPCSIHDIDAAKEYAAKLKALHDEMHDTIYVVMRVYFEKPRTTVGWKGFINDPYLDDSFQIGDGLTKARELLIWLAELGLPVGTEALDPISPQYLSDLFAWSAIGARTTESQTHRELASGLSTPVGFKNGTDGSLTIAINALQSAASGHSFLGINQQGQVTVLRTTGNAYGHVILRGGNQPNYDSVNIALCEEALEKAKLPKNIVVDCSHGNSNKKPELQPLVADNVANQIVEGNRSIVGLMLESHLQEGNQKIPADLNQLQYGLSVTDACMGWDRTEQLLRNLYQKLKPVMSKRSAA